RCHRATQVPVYELEPLPGSEARLLGEGVLPLLRQHADVAELLHMVKAWEASHHLLGAEPLQGLKVEVPKALVPLPCLVVPASCKTKRLAHPDVEDVEAVLPSNHPGEKLATVVPDAEDPAVDHHAGAALIELPKADDGVP